MALEIPAAEVSPQNDSGIIKFYAGDTFELHLELDLKDQDGEPIIFNNETDTLTITFKDKRKQVVKTFAFGGDDEPITDNIAVLLFDDTVTALFPEGVYTYDGVFTNTERRVTIIKNAPLVVMDLGG